MNQIQVSLAFVYVNIGHWKHVTEESNCGYTAYPPHDLQSAFLLYSTDLVAPLYSSSRVTLQGRCRKGEKMRRHLLRLLTYSSGIPIVSAFFFRLLPPTVCRWSCYNHVKYSLRLCTYELEVTELSLTSTVKTI